MHSVYLSLGSNIRPEQNIPKALELLSAELKLIQVSSAWCTEPVGTAGPNFVNLAVHASTAMDCANLKTHVLQSIELQLGRIRSADKFAPRTIDIDIILFDDDLIEDDLADTAYLVLPLAELIPSYIPPGGKQTLEKMAAQDSIRQTATRLDGFPDLTCG